MDKTQPEAQRSAPPSSGWRGVLANLSPSRALREKQTVFSEFDLLYRESPQAALLAKAMWLTGRGQAYARRGRLFQALDCYAEAMDLKHDHIPAHLGLAISFRRLGQSSGGWGYIGKAVEILSQLPRRVRLAQEDLALELFGSTLYSEWATLHIIMGERAKAAEDLRKALRYHEEAQTSDGQARSFLLASGLRLDAEFALNMRNTLAVLQAR